MSKRYYDKYPSDRSYEPENHLDPDETSEPVSHPAEQESMEPVTKTGIVVGADLVRLRAEPSLEAPVLTTIRSNEQVQITSGPSDDQKDFYGVEHDKFKGFIHQRFLAIK